MTFDNTGKLWATGGGNIYYITPGGVVTTFVSGLSYSIGGLAVDSVNNVFVSDYNYGGGSFEGNIYEYSPSGTQSTFAAGVGYSSGLAIDSEGYIWDYTDAGDSGEIYVLTPAGTVAKTYNGAHSGSLLAFSPVPEPSFFGLLATSAVAFLICRRLHLKSFTEIFTWRTLN